MHIVSWNFQGLCNLHAFPNLKYLAQLYNVDVIILCETFDFFASLWIEKDFVKVLKFSVKPL